MGRKRDNFDGVKSPEQNKQWREELGRNVAHWRLVRGISQQALANRTSTNRPQISKIELGTTVPKAEHLLEIAQALQVDLRDIVPPIVFEFELSHEEATHLLVQRIQHVRQDLEDVEELAQRLLRPEPIRDPRVDTQRRAKGAKLTAEAIKAARLALDEPEN